MPGRICGRAFELQQMDKLLHAALTGRSGVLIIEGPPGSGRSRLLQEAARTAGKLNFDVHSCQTQTLDAENLKAMRKISCAGPLESRNPALVIADGVHSVTAPFMADFLASRSEAEPPSIWMASMRADHARPGRQPLFSVEEDHVARIELLPLSRSAVEEMVADLLGAAPDPEFLAMVVEAGGNPLLIVDLIEGLQTEGRVRVQEGIARLVGNQVPQRVHATAGSWLSGLTGKAQQLIQVGAVLGPSFALRDIADLQSTTMASLLTVLDEVLASQVLVLVGDQLAFHYPLVRRSIEETIPAPVLRVLRQDAELMRARRSSPPTVAQAMAPGRVRLMAQDRTPAIGTAGRLVPALFLARGSLTRPLHGGLVEDLHSALTYQLAASAGHGELIASAAEARRIVELFVDDERVARDRARSILAGEDGTAALPAAAVLSNLDWGAGNLTEGLLRGRDAVRRVNPTVPPAWWPYPALALAAKLADIGELGEAESLIGAAQDDVDRLGLDPAWPTWRLPAAACSSMPAVSPRPARRRRPRCPWPPNGGRTGRSRRAWRCWAPWRCGSVSRPQPRPDVAVPHGTRSGVPSVPAGAVVLGRVLGGRFPSGAPAGGTLARHSARGSAGAPAAFHREPGRCAVAGSAGPFCRRHGARCDRGVTAVERLAAANPGHRSVSVAAVEARKVLGLDLHALESAVKEHPHPWASASAWRTPGRTAHAACPGPRTCTGCWTGSTISKRRPTPAAPQSCGG